MSRGGGGGGGGAVLLITMCVVLVTELLIREYRTQLDNNVCCIVDRSVDQGIQHAA